MHLLSLIRLSCKRCQQPLAPRPAKPAKKSLHRADISYLSLNSISAPHLVTSEHKITTLLFFCSRLYIHGTYAEFSAGILLRHAKSDVLQFAVTVSAMLCHIDIKTTSCQTRRQTRSWPLISSASLPHPVEIRTLDFARSITMSASYRDGDTGSGNG